MSTRTNANANIEPENSNQTTAPKYEDFKAIKFGIINKRKMSSQILQSQRISNMKQWKEKNVKNLAQSEE